MRARERVQGAIKYIAACARCIRAVALKHSQLWRLLAATAGHHDLRLITRNTRDSDYAGLEVINPWKTAVRGEGAQVQPVRPLFFTAQ